MSARPDPVPGLLPGPSPSGGGSPFLRKAAAAVTGTVLVVLGLAFSLVFLAVAAVGAAVVWGYIAWKTRALRRSLNDGRGFAVGPDVIEGVAVKLPDEPH
ncbi:MAG TPA: hypothetical protein VII68_00505 [Casimicrobiaceae bacterium]